MHTLFDSILTVLLAPLGMFCKTKKCDNTLFLNILLAIFTVDTFAIIHAFCVYGLTLSESILCLLLPPIAVCIYHGGCMETLISLLLTCCGIIPGIIYSYHILVKKVEGETNYSAM